MIAIVGVVGEEDDPVLPIQFRLVEADLSELPVRIDRIRSCSCWHGPRDQAQRKYKFRVVNETDEVINIDGGQHSMVRLIVAYPHRREPRVTMPSQAGRKYLRHMDSPPDIEVSVTDALTTVRPSEIPDSNEFFGVPDNYSVWALPATPNKLAEPMAGGTEASYPTVVDKPHLLPGEEYEGHRLGHGTWTFYIPLPHRFAQRFLRVWEPLLPRQAYERYVVFVGVAALAPDPRGGVRLLGFAPAPSENAIAEPGEL
jgi:hypothetical protein